ncbi:hypothetical protein Tco_0874685 [Tanacetum coccineum]|uniref:Integrase, catalytic region, zinc finger, CCHC-type, peptidase aspartic, catalytic n=1 Tax=Tanacetum coccineum TaxID=301880 RepID=A0ABQ5BP09_9ASTR
MLYNGTVIAKETNVISIADSKETLMLEEESRSKMFLKQKLSIEQAFSLKSSPSSEEPSTSSTPVKTNVPKELLKTLKDTFNNFDQCLLDEIIEVQTVFNQMEQAMEQCRLETKSFEIQKKQFLIENDRLLDQIISQNIVNIVVNSFENMNTFVNVNSSVALNYFVNYVEKCNKCLELKAELIKQHNMVEKDEYNRNNTSVNQTEPTFDQLFELNNLKYELQAKDTTIEKLKANIKGLNKTSTTNSMKKDIDEIETINTELEHRVAKLISKNEHLKQTYKQLYDSIKPSCVCAKEHTKSLVNQLNQKYVEIIDLNAQLQEKVFVITTLKNDLRKLKGKDIVDNDTQVSNATTIASGMYKLDPVTLAPKDKNNKGIHIYYLKHTMEQAAILREIVEHAKSLNPLDNASYSALSRSTKSSMSKSTDNTKNDMIMQISSSTLKKNKVEDHSRIVNSICDARNELCFLEFVFDMNACSRSKSVKKAKKKEEWKPTGKMITATNEVPFRKPILLEVVAQEPVVTKVYPRRPKVVQIVLWYLDSGCSKHMTEDRSQLTNFVQKFLGTVKFGNDYIAKIIGILGNQPLYIVHGGYNGVFSNLSLVQSLKDQILVMAPMIVTFEKTRDLSYLHVVVVALCYPNNDSEDLGKLQAKADIGIFIGYAPKKKAYRIYNRRTQKSLKLSSSGLVTNLIPQQPCNPPKRDDWDRLFQPMFDEYFNPPTIVVSPVPVAVALRAVNLADSPVSTSIDQDASSTSIPSTQEQEHITNISQGFEESPKTRHFHDDPLHESLHEDSTSQGSSSNVRPIHTSIESLGRWTKYHPIANVIRDPSRSVSTRKQLKTDAMWCYFYAFLTSIEPKKFKQEMTEPS